MCLGSGRLDTFNSLYEILKYNATAGQVNVFAFNSLYEIPLTVGFGFPVFQLSILFMRFGIIESM